MRFRSPAAGGRETRVVLFAQARAVAFRLAYVIAIPGTSKPGKHVDRSISFSIAVAPELGDERDAAGLLRRLEVRDRFRRHDQTCPGDMSENRMLEFEQDVYPSALVLL